MADNNILGGKLSLEDGYSSPLDKFASAVLGAENKFKQFANSINGSNEKIVTETSKTSQQVERIAQKFIQQGDTVANAINKANDRVAQNQEKTIERLSQKYIKLGMTIQDAYSKAQQDSNAKWNGDDPNSNGSGGNNLKDFVQSFLQSGIGGIIGKLGLIGAGITTGIAVMKTLNNWMEQGFDLLNKATDGLLSPEGIKNAVEESMDFETGRMKLNLFYGNKDKGLEAYQDATYVAKKTFANERDTIEISSKLGQLGINPSQKQLEKLVDVAGTRPEVETDHIGLAVKEAVEGRVAMLQMYGINNKNLKKFYDGLRKTDPQEYKNLKGALSKKGTADNPQKYFNLLTDYIEKSPMNGYAETYAQTVQGKIERMTGVWDNLKAEMMGIDINTGTAKPGGVFSVVAEEVDHLKDVLEDEGTANSIEKVGKAFGNAFESLGKAFTKAVTPETIDKVASAIAKIGDALANMINKLVDSGQLDELLDKLPDLVEKTVGNEMISKTTDFKVAVDAAQGDWTGVANDWISGKEKQTYNLIGLPTKYTDDNKNIAGKSSQEASRLPFSDFSDWLEVKLGGAANDVQIDNAIDKNSNLSDNEKSQLKDVIDNDGKNVYHITIGKIEANNFDEIMNSIEGAKGNRK
ncbi:hypothetical protein [uncultured Clostridium sp.]|uniref:hypothetical protein n=1 Tax=uncultured Clostridium sp. TaxID=59620 RepID=UPI0028E30CB6|nr:hypothetical protein [uncultured Clostridium sp.]